MINGLLLDAKKILKDVGVRTGDRVADFGAGRTGHFVFPATKLVGDEGAVYAVDLVKDVLAMIDGRSKLFGILNLHTVWGDFEREGGVKIKEHSLDWVFIVNNIWCVKDIGVLAHEARRVLKPGGKIVIVDWRRNAENPAAPQKEQRKEAMEIESRFLQEGIAKDRDLQVNDTHWGIVLKLS